MNLNRYAEMFGLLVMFVLSPMLQSSSNATHIRTDPTRVDWIQHEGTDASDSPEGVAVDYDGNVFVVGWTRGNLGGTQPSFRDVFLSKYDAGGTLQWIKQFDSGASDLGHDIAIDAQGHLYVAGWTYGGFDTAIQYDVEAFLQKFDNDGDLIWNRQLSLNNQTIGAGVAVNEVGSVVLTGFSTFDVNRGGGDAFLALYDSNGHQQWTRELTSNDHEQGQSVAIDEIGNVYMTGYTNGDLEGPNLGWSDVFLSKYNSTGELLWTNQFGTDTIDIGDDVVIDDFGGIYVTGHTHGNLAAPITGIGYRRVDAFVSKFDEEGNEVWTRQIGFAERDYSESITVDASGNVYIAGSTEGALEGESHGKTDAFVSKLDQDGNLKWTQQLGSSASDWNDGIAVDGQGGIWITGSTQGDFGGPKQGDFADTDLFVAL